MNIRFTKYLALAAFGFVLASCADEELIQTTQQYRDGDPVTLSFNISIPDAEEVAVTRATSEENRVQDLTLLVFSDNSTEGVLEQVYTSYSSGPFANTGTMTDGADDAHKKFTATVQASTTDKALYILANAGFLLTNRSSDNFDLKIGITTVNDLRQLQTYETPPNFIMSGCKVLPIPHAELLTQDFPLYRCHAKVTVDVAESLQSDFQLEGFYLCNAQANGSVVSYQLYKEPTDAHAQLPEATENPDEDKMGNEEWMDFDGGMYIDEAQYPAPTANEAISTSGKNTKIFLLVKGSYKGDTYYYHADFETGEGPLNVLPNHYYRVTITHVDRIGYVHSFEGFKGAIAGAENISVDIKDIEPTSHHMASDGVTEIGIENDTLYVGRTTPEGDGEVTFQVTVYPSVKTDGAEVTIDEGGASWLVLSNDASKTVEKDITIDGRSDKYSITTVTLHTTVPNLAGEYREARVGISCRGVMCYVTVIDEPEFSAHEFGEVSLKVKEYERGDDWQITNPAGTELGTYNDYWAFIRGNDTTDKLYGIQPDDMGGKVRTEGFHAPMSDYQQFIYTFKVPDSDDETFRNCTWHIELADDYQTNSEGEPFLLFWTGDASPAGSGTPIDQFEYHTSEQSMNGQTFTFTNNLLDLQAGGNITEDAYRYGEKAFRIVVTRPGGQKVVFAYDLYHTGVFDYYNGNSGYEVGNRQIQPGWYYYEVILMGSNYWLDRNLGATSASYYTQEVGAGDPDAAGGLYRIAKNDNGSPALLSDEELEAIAPKGFRVPTMTEFQIMTQDHRFRHANEGTYWTNYYDTGKPEQGVVYFPKSGMWYNGSASGSSSTGYYWTQSEALGSSGTEVGWWLQNMQLAGSNASTNRYRIQASNTSNYTGMSVRCVYNSRKIETINTIEFYVKGYTHVFLYYQEPGSSERTYLNAWPGDQIAVNDEASLNMYHTFKYESMMDYDYRNLKAVFTVVETNPESADYLEVQEVYPSDYATNGGLTLSENDKFFRKGNTSWTYTAN